MKQIEYRRKNRMTPQGQHREPNGDFSPKLTLREELFIRAICCYPDDPTFDNVSEAMRKAGYKGKNVGFNAYKMLQKPKIAESIDRYRLKMMKEFDIAPRKILQEIAATAFVNFQDFYSSDGTLKGIRELGRAEAAALHGVDVQCGVIPGPDGNPIRTVTQKIRLHDKLKGLELLGKYHKLWTDNVTVNLDSDITQDEKAEQQRKRLLEALTDDEDDGKE